jgi:hypothetical protein
MLHLVPEPESHRWVRHPTSLTLLACTCSPDRWTSEKLKLDYHHVTAPTGVTEEIEESA